MSRQQDPSDRKAKLASALRENLKRRKAQSRSKAAEAERAQSSAADDEQEGERPGDVAGRDATR